MLQLGNISIEESSVAVLVVVVISSDHWSAGHGDWLQYTTVIVWPAQGAAVSRP